MTGATAARLAMLAAAGAALAAAGCKGRAPATDEQARRATRATLPDAGAGAAGSSAAVAGGGPADAAAPRPRGRQLTVLHSSNLRGEYDGHPLGGLARRATAVVQARAEADAVLQLDAGDTVLPELLSAPVPGRVPPDPAEVERRARLVLAGLAAAGLDALTPGERDLALGPARLGRLARAARVPLLAANLIDGDGRRWFAADRLVRAAGLVVGIFGVVISTGPDQLASLGVTVTDPAAAAAGAVASLRQRGARLVIALVHAGSGREEAERLVRATPGIHLAVLGHGGEALDPPPAAGGTLLLEAGQAGTYLGRLDLHLVGDEPDPAQALAASEAGPSWFTHRIVRLDEAFARDPRVRALVAGYVRESRRREAAGRPVGPGPQQPRPGAARRAGGGGSVPEPPAEIWTYASTAGCNFCHMEEVAQWKTTAHAYALDTLDGRGRGRDPACLACHTTGFERPGGTRNLVTATTYLAGVGCESCHGPSVPHVRAQDRSGTRRDVPEAVCAECHRSDKSLIPFDYRTALQRVLGPGHGAQ